MKRLSYLILMLSLCNWVNGENWVRVDQAKTSESYIDADSIKKNDDYMQYWQTVLFRDKNNKLIQIRTLNEVDCFNRQGRILAAIGYWKDGAIIRDDTIRDWESINFDTPNELAYRYACNKAFFMSDNL